MHPSNVVEVQIKKEHTNAKAGQYIFLYVDLASAIRQLLSRLTDSQS